MKCLRHAQCRLHPSCTLQQHWPWYIACKSTVLQHCHQTKKHISGTIMRGTHASQYSAVTALVHASFTTSLPLAALRIIRLRAISLASPHNYSASSICTCFTPSHTTHSLLVYMHTHQQAMDNATKTDNADTVEQSFQATHVTLTPHCIIPHHCTEAHLTLTASPHRCTHTAHNRIGRLRQHARTLLGRAQPLHYLPPPPHSAAIVAVAGPQEGSTP